MSIIDDYPAIAAQMKGDTWWKAEKPQPEIEEQDPVLVALMKPNPDPLMSALEIVNQAIHEVERVFAVPEDMLQPGRIRFRTPLPPATWRQINAK